MSDVLIQTRLMTLLVFTAVMGLVWTIPQLQASTAEDGYLAVHFLDVGQGDAIFIETPDGVQVLIDGGADSGVLRELGSEMAVSDRMIDMVVGTHPDKDHIGGLVDVLERYDVGIIITTEKESETQVAATYKESMLREGAEVIYARRGQVFQLGASTTLHVLYPETNPTALESNTSSIIVQLVYGDIEFMLTGDSPKSIEEYLVLRDGEHLESEVLKAGHHGSRTSTSELFLSEVAPQFAVISASKDNRYGHPHVEVTDMLFNNGVETLSTADAGTITFLSDGKRVWVK